MIESFPTTREPGHPFDPDPAYAELRGLDTLPKLACPAGIDAYVVTDYHQVRTVLANPTVSSRGAASFHTQPGHDFDAPIYPGNVIQHDGEGHHRLRRLLMPEFTVRRTRALSGYIQQVINEHIDSMLAKDGQADLIADLAMPVPSLVICELLGVPSADRHKFVGWAQAMMNTGIHRSEQKGPGNEFIAYMYELAGSKMADPSDDLIGRLFERSQDEGSPLTVQELAHLSLVLLVAGHETTANMIGLSTLALLTDTHRDTLAALQTEPDRFAEPAVEEMLRYLTVVQFGVLRYATQDLEVGEHTIKAGDWVVASLAAGNRDSRAFPEPDTVDLAREDPRTHLAFGYGAHQCVGQQLARLELIEIFRTLYRRIPTLRLAAPIENVPFKAKGLTYGVRQLPVAWDA
ncbi:MAG TPA: cytochrome P450 [Pseudonocardiaceae bacterium]|nr:cytochrome P450 [Pseudonocardiaceae bacterium]